MLEAVYEIEDDHEPFTNPEDAALSNDFVPDTYESSDFSDSDDEEEYDFCKDKVVDVVENKIIIKEEDKTIQEEPILLTQPLLTLTRARSNIANSPSRKFENVKPSMTNATVASDKVKTVILNKNKD